MKRGIDFLSFLAHAGEYDLFRVGPGFERAKQLTAGNDVESTARFGESPQERDVGVCLYRETNDVRNFREGLIKNAEVALQCREAIDISRRSDFLRDALYGDRKSVV